ncbi:MAG: hypothetical protein ABR512_01090 [Desulfopila sp.]
MSGPKEFLDALLQFYTVLREFQGKIVRLGDTCQSHLLKLDSSTPGGWDEGFGQAFDVW